jgi:cytidine deaminase
MTNQLIQLAKKKASQSLSKYRISAIALDDRGNVLGSAMNRPRFDHHGGGVHAEIAVLSKFGPKVKTIILCRIGNDGDILPIHPCKRCKKVLDKKGIKVYSIHEQ